MGGNWKWEKGERGKENKKEQERVDELEHSPSWKGVLESEGRNCLLARVAGALWERDRLKKEEGEGGEGPVGPIWTRLSSQGLGKEVNGLVYTL